MSNVTINIKNCGCGGSTTGTTTPTTPPITGPSGGPNNPGGPPDGFFEPTSGLSDRQCKTAVWLYDWLDGWLEWLATTYPGSIVVGGIQNVAYITETVPWLAAYLVPAATGVAGVFALFLGGPDPSDVAITYLANAMASSLLISLAQVSAELITQPLLQDALAKVRASQDEIICQLSRASTVEGGIQAFQNTIEDTITDLTPEQSALILGFMPRELISFLFWTSVYWPTFDDDYLAGITTTCCGDYANDDPVVANSTQHCQASWYIVEQLAATMERVYDTRGYWYNANPFDNDRPDIYRYLENNLVTPAKIKARAYSYPSFLNAVTEFTYTEFILITHYADLNEFYDFAQYIYSQADTLTAALRTATDTTEAYNALQPLRDWITTNITDSDAQNWMLQALDALIKPRADGNGILDLLFRQDSDLAFYATDKCASGGTAEGYLTAILSVTPSGSGVIEDENYLLGADDDQGLYIKDAGDNTVSYIEADFGQVYTDAVRLDLRVRTDTLASSGRRLYKSRMFVKEDVGDDWTEVGTMYFNQSSLDDFEWHDRAVTFTPRPVRYVRFIINRGQNVFTKNGWMWMDSLQVTTDEQ